MSFHQTQVTNQTTNVSLSRGQYLMQIRAGYPIHSIHRSVSPVVAFLILITLLVSIGCKKSSDATNSTPTLRKVRIGYVGLTCDSDLFVAYEKGFFKDEGLDAELVKFP